jgi:acyl-CoA synthetase (AMP-forming)/AMP-acid ligase II/acyl carrier protein
MLSHSNLLSNSKLIHGSFGSRSSGWGVSWLPLYHDMGLIGGMIQPLYCGGSSTLLAPAAFLQRPMLWLETISRTRSIISGGPDFAYELCARKISAAERERLDLSCWEVAFTGAEPIRARTLDHFVEAFSPCGFRREMFYTCYGLAEGTLIVSGGPRLTGPKVVHVDPIALAHNDVQHVPKQQNGARSVVGCGVSLPGQRVLVVNPDVRVPCQDGRIGEIWVQGPSVAQGYYDSPEATEAAFGAYLADGDDGPFLRTGDLGFLKDGQLYVTGRLKDLIIIRGRNYYPQDIEHSVEQAHEAFRVGHCAALAVDDGDQEQLVIIQEIEPRHRDLDKDSAIGAIRRAVAEHHELETHAIVLAKAGALPKTTSGKTRRFAARELYLNGQLKARAEWEDETTSVRSDADGDDGARAPKAVTADQIEHWLVERIGTRCRMPRNEVHVNKPFADFGMTSLDAVEISADLEKWLARDVPPTVVYNYPNIGTLAQWLARPVIQADCHPEGTADSPEAGQSTNDEHESLESEVRELSDEELEAYLSSEMSELED